MSSIATSPLCLVFVVLWSSGWVGSKYSLGHMGAFNFLSWRYLLVVVILALLVLFLGTWRSLNRRELASHALVGFLAHAGYLSTSLMAMQMGVSAGMVAFVTASQPMLVAAVSRPITGESVSRTQWCGIALGLLAVALVVGDRIVLGGSVLAYLLLILSVFCITFASVIDRRGELVRRASRKKRTPLSFVLLIHCAAAYLWFSVLAFTIEGFSVSFTTTVVCSLLYMAIVVSIGSFGLMFYLLRRLSATKVSSLSYLTPPVTMVIAWWWFGEQLSSIDLLGLCVSALAVMLVTRVRPATTKPATTAPVPVRTRHWDLDIELA